MKNTDVSIIIPTFNSALYIRDALESVFSQSYDSYELIVIDDGSDDDTRTILEPYLNRLHFIYQEHGGVSVARNRGLSMASGKYVTFLDSDDIFFHDKLAIQAAFLDDHLEVGAVHSGWHLIDENKKLITKKEPWHQAPKLDLEDWLMWQPIFLGAMMFRRSWLKKVGEFDTSLTQAEDTEFLLRLAMKGCPTSWLKQPTVYYRQHGSGITKNSLDRVVCVNKVIENFFSKQELPEAARLLEKKVRYQILMWSVWLLYRSGNSDQIVDYLQKTLAYLNDSPKHIIHGWLMALIKHCRADREYEIEELRNFWPYFKEAMQGEEAVLAQCKQLFYWLLSSETQLKFREGDKSIIGYGVIKEK